MNAFSQPLARSEAIVWQPPAIDDFDQALNDTDLMVSRLRVLVSSTNNELNEVLTSTDYTADFLRMRLVDMWMIYCIAEEKLGELEAVVGAIVEAAVRASHERATSVAKHVDLARSRAWRETVNAMDDAKADQVNDDTNAASDAVLAAFRTVLGTRAGTPSDFREKLAIIQEAGAWHAPGAIDALFADLDALGWHSATKAEG